MTLGRDLTVVALFALAWWWDAAERARGGPPSAAALAAAVAAGVSAGAVGFVAHEWGHLAATLLAGGRVFYPNRLLAPLLFHFDAAKNDRRQFLWMSGGGYLASALGVAAIAALAPLSATSGRIALGLAVAGLAATLVGEVPTTLRVLRGAPLPDGYAFRAPAGGSTPSAG